MKRIATFLILLFFIMSPMLAQKNNKPKEALPSDEVMSALVMTCYVCHNPRVKSHDNVIAPPLVAVKYMYKIRYKEKETFVNKMTDFIMYPTNQKAIMQGPVMKFGVMPDMPMEEEQVRQIVSYLFDNEIEEPAWFAEYFKKRHGMEWKGQ